MLIAARETENRKDNSTSKQTMQNKENIKHRLVMLQHIGELFNPSNPSANKFQHPNKQFVLA